jgi:hypothetical protein
MCRPPRCSSATRALTLLHAPACACCPNLLLLPLVQAVYSLDDGTVDLFGLHG